MMSPVICTMKYQGISLICNSLKHYQTTTSIKHRYIFSQGYSLYFFPHFFSFMVVWGFGVGVLDWVLGVFSWWGLGSVVWGLLGFWGWCSLYKNERITPGIKCFNTMFWFLTSNSNSKAPKTAILASGSHHLTPQNSQPAHPSYSDQCAPMSVSTSRESTDTIIYAIYLRVFYR